MRVRCALRRGCLRHLARRPICKAGEKRLWRRQHRDGYAVWQVQQGRTLNPGAAACEHPTGIVLERRTRNLCLRCGAVFSAEWIPHLCFPRRMGRFKTTSGKGTASDCGAEAGFERTSSLRGRDRIGLGARARADERSCHAQATQGGPPRFEREWNAAGSWTLLALPRADSH